MRAAHRDKLLALAAPEPAENVARDAVVERHGPACAAWLVRKHKRLLHRRGAFDVVVPYTVKELPFWFALAVDFLRRREGWSAEEVTGKKAHARRFRIVWKGWLARSRARLLKALPG